MTRGPNKEPEGPQVVVVILNWNGRELLESCLRSLERTTSRSSHVVVVDNGSTDGSQHMVRTLFSEVHLVENPRNYGCCISRNVGISRGLELYDPDYFVIMDNDVKVIDPNWLSELIGVAETDKRIAVVAPKVLRPDGRIDFALGTSFPRIMNLAHGETDRGQYDFRAEADIVTGACFLCKRTVLEVVGAYDEAYEPRGYEDIDLLLRIKRAGFRVAFTGRTKVLHCVSGTQRRFLPSERMYLGLRNYFRCIRLNFGLAFFILRTALTGFHVVRKRKQVSPGQFVKALAASFEPRRIPRPASPSVPLGVHAPNR
ncbi:MAG: glycosyltransferase family 2 protein [Aigarchaeota archaeon]|nr:glycosyltransferase family 2 protein [Aigarchaeota archaeon]